MRGIALALKGLVNVVGLPPWVVGIFFFGVLYALIANIRKTTPASMAMGTLKRASFAAPAERSDMEKEALERVWDDPGGLALLADAAARMDNERVGRQAVERLHTFAGREAQVKRLSAKFDKRNTKGPEFEVIAIRNLLEEGLEDMARVRLNRARSCWPADEELAELAQQIDGCVEGSA